jgi:hypothetical protein
LLFQNPNSEKKWFKNQENQKCFRSSLQELKCNNQYRGISDSEQSAHIKGKATTRS